MIPLPSFRSPPVVEVAIAVQFEPVQGLTGPMLGVLWSKVRDKFPTVQVHPSRDQAEEQFDPPNQPTQFNVVFGIGPPPPLVWYIHEDDSELIQIQRDRFVFNWRRREGEYPRYEHVRARFIEFFSIVRDFLEEEGLADELGLNHWEVTYVNLIQSDTTWKEHREVGVVIPSWEHRVGDEFLPDPEDVALRVRYRINDDDGRPRGRLHIVLEPGFDVVSNEQLLNLRLTARGKFDEPATNEELLRFLDIGHEWIVRGFCSITSETMHHVWGRER